MLVAQRSGWVGGLCRGCFEVVQECVEMSVLVLSIGDIRYEPGSYSRES